MGIYYLTYACDFHCPYCSDGSGIPYPRLPSKILRGEQLNELLRRIRRTCDFLVITGGEPFLHPDIAFLLRHLPEHHFKGVILTTIGYEIGPYLEAIASSIRYLTFSLDTMDPLKANQWLGKGPGAFERILDNIEKARILPARRYEIIISSVATPDNLPDLYAVYRFAQDRAFRFAVCPVLRGVHPDPALFDNADYQHFFDFLIQEKKKGSAINGTITYLKYLRDLRPFQCRPSTLLAVSPIGDIFFPCLEIGKVAGNLLTTDRIHTLRREGLRLYGPEPRCGNQCHSACALGFSLALNQPWTLVPELLHTLKARWYRYFTP